MNERFNWRRATSDGCGMARNCSAQITRHFAQPSRVFTYWLMFGLSSCTRPWAFVEIFPSSGHLSACSRMETKRRVWVKVGNFSSSSPAGFRLPTHMFAWPHTRFPLSHSRTGCQMCRHLLAARTKLPVWIDTAHVCIYFPLASLALRRVQLSIFYLLHLALVAPPLWLVPAPNGVRCLCRNETAKYVDTVMGDACNVNDASSLIKVLSSSRLDSGRITVGIPSALLRSIDFQPITSLCSSQRNAALE